MRDIEGEVVAIPVLSVAVNNHLLVILIHITIIYISMITWVSVTALISVGITIPPNNTLLIIRGRVMGGWLVKTIGKITNQPL